MVEKVIITKSEKETFDLGVELAKSLRKGSVICLRGDLGAGKTVFSKGLCEGLGVAECISSPTFTIVNEYEGEKLPVFHFDMYRIEDEDELIEIGYDEYLMRGGVCIIEWPQNIQNSLPKTRTDIDILRDLSIGDDVRKITVRERA